MGKKQLITFLLFAAICGMPKSFKELPEQFSDRFLAGQLLYVQNRFYGYERYLESLNYGNFSEYTRDCNWGFYFRIEKATKTPNVGLIFRF